MGDWVFWLCTVFLLAFVEMSTVGLVSIWFIASAIVSLFLSFFVKNFLIQFAVFVLLGIFLLVESRPLLKKWMKVKPAKTNLDRIIGMEGVVTEEITKHTIGEIKVDGKTWSAIANKKIEKGEFVIVEAMEGVKLIVRKKESDD